MGIGLADDHVIAYRIDLSTLVSGDNTGGDSGRARHLDGAELAKLQRIDELVKHAFDELDVAVGSLNVNGGTAQAHRHSELGFERT